VYAYWITVNYRESYGIFACNGILFNHESPRRGENFVTKKITRNLARIKLGLQDSFSLGNLDAKRDWGHAQDYVEAMWQMLQHDVPGDYVIATNETHTVREFIEEACRLLDIDIAWKGKGIKEHGIDMKTGKTIITLDPAYFRPAEVDLLIGDYSKAKQTFGWEPRRTFTDLVKLMIESDMEREALLNPQAVRPVKEVKETPKVSRTSSKK
jgi:GDPmannose 4,6-dehydratase